LADENIPLYVVKQLRKEGYQIIPVAEKFAGSSDEKILELSSRNKWVIITFDKDFGELIYKQKSSKPYGIILLRVTPKSPEYILQLLKWLLLQGNISFEGNFVVVNKDKVRTIKMSGF
jgi:predicted nuclease of predicted toxin-antitoxin system